MSERAVAATAVLRAAGLDPATVAATPAALEPWLTALAGPDATAIVGALGDLGTPAAAALLQELEPRLPALRRAIRRALFVMQQRGLTLPAATTAEPAVAARRPTHFDGYLTGFDGRGDRIGWLIHAAPGGATTLVIAIFNEPEGLKDVRATAATRKQIRAARERMMQANRIRLVPVDGDVLDALLIEAHDRLSTRERAQDYRRVRQKLTSTSPLPTVAEPRSNKVAALDADTIGAGVARSAELLAEPECASWWPAPAQLVPFVERLRALRESPIVLAPGQQDARLHTIVDEAARTLYPAPVLARRLLGTAYVFAETGRLLPASIALAVAHTLDTAPTTTALPLTTHLIHRALGTLLASQEQTQQAERQESLVLTPSEALKASAPSRPRHTRG